MHAHGAQGWGNFINTAIICILLAIFGQTGKNYNNRSLEAVWRLSFGLGLIPVTGMLIYRLFFLQESKVWVRKHKGAEVRSKLLTLSQSAAVSSSSSGGSAARGQGDQRVC